MAFQRTEYLLGPVTESDGINPRVITPQALSDLPDDQASMGVPAHEEETSPMGYCRVSYRERPKSQHTADMYLKIPWPKFSEVGLAHCKST